MRQIFNDNILQEEFLPKGHVKVPMLSQAEVDTILAEIGNLHPSDNFDPGTGGSPYGTTYHCSFLDPNVDYKRKTYDLIKKVFTSYMDRYLNNYEIMSANFYVKPPHTGEFTIHQNWPVLDINDTSLTIWCPLQDVTATNGGIQVVEGSHKILPHIEGPTNPPYFKGFTQELIQKYLKAVPMAAGEGLIFDDGLIHWSANNDSDTPRIAIQILITPKDATPVYYYFNPQDAERFEMVAVDKEFFLNQSIVDITRRQPHWKHVGYARNENRYITESEFADLLRRGNEIRRKAYRGEEPPRSRMREMVAAVMRPLRRPPVQSGNVRQ